VGTPALESRLTTQLSYQGETLAQAVSELNRHNHRRRLVIADQRIAHVKLSGRFDASDPDSFVAALVPLGVLGLSNRRKDDEIRLVGARGRRR
jgi:ferric-dicitrate binding protein FerR (iron transport regulator)